MFRYKEIKSRIIVPLMKGKTRRMLDYWSETMDIILYFITFLNALNLMGIKVTNVIAIRAITGLGGVGKVMCCILYSIHKCN